MPLMHLEAALILGIVIPQIFSISISSPPSDCFSSVDTCLSDLCKSEQAFYNGICGDDGCQIKASEVCNMTIQIALDQFPSLRGCVCAWEEEELCDSIQALATQCQLQPVQDGAGSCFDQMKVCITDTVCNRHLAPVLQACVSEQCDREHCQQETQRFYNSMPRSVAELLVMCECEASDQTCEQMKRALQSGTCGDNTWICQDTVTQCVADSNCRDLLKTLQTKCWSSEEAQCSDSELHRDQCLTQMDPAFIFGADSECKTAFLDTLGTALHYPCTCRGVHSDALLTCNMIHDVFHNRSHFMKSLKSSSAPSKPAEITESEEGHTWSQDYFLYAIAAVLLVEVLILMPLAVFCKIWMLRRRDKTKLHHPQKSNCAVIL
ncbi:GDNF family receptor alpha-like [Symphorus nematophorus]